ncbi:MAG: hypothetical protein JJU37_00440 [Balneolaceae bacterium]|nr:hypothetical protein [Balneolaceae bacterium]
MKKLSVIAFTILFAIGISGTTVAQQSVNQGDISVGGGISITTGIGSGGSFEPGINVNGFYSITDEIRAGAGLSLYFGDFSPTEFNLDGHYIFKDEDGLVLYGLAGIGFFSWSFDTGFGSVSFSTSGLNLGAGLEYDLGNMFLFAEPKINTAAGTPLNLTGGVRFRF